MCCLGIRPYWLQMAKFRESWYLRLFSALCVFRVFLAKPPISFFLTFHSSHWGCLMPAWLFTLFLYTWEPAFMIGQIGPTAILLTLLWWTRISLWLFFNVLWTLGGGLFWPSQDKCGGCLVWIFSLVCKESLKVHGSRPPPRESDCLKLFSKQAADFWEHLPFYSLMNCF